jgi:hypothetical protein
MIKLLSASAAVALSLWFAGAAVAMPANALQGARSAPAIQLVRDDDDRGARHRDRDDHRWDRDDHHHWWWRWRHRHEERDAHRDHDRDRDHDRR